MSNWFTDTIGSLAGDAQYYLGGGSSIQSQSDQLQNQLANLNKQDYSPGGRIYNKIAASMGVSVADATWQRVQSDLQPDPSVLAQLQTAGQQGASAGLDSLAGGIQSVFSGVFGTIFKLIPWQLWLIGGLALFVWLGGLEMLKGSLNKRK